MKFEELNKSLESILFPKPTFWQKIYYKYDLILRKLQIRCNHSFILTGNDSDRKCSKCELFIKDPAPRHFNCRCAMVAFDEASNIPEEIWRLAKGRIKK